MELWYKFYGTCDDINVVCLASHNTSPIEFWYKLYRTYTNINDLCMASYNITSPSKKNNMIPKQTQISQWKTYVLSPKFPIFWHPLS